MDEKAVVGFFPLSWLEEKNLHVVIVNKLDLLVISIDLVSQFGRLN